MRKLLKRLFTFRTPTPEERLGLRRVAVCFTAYAFYMAFRAMLAGKLWPAAILFSVAVYFTSLFYLHPPA